MNESKPFAQGVRSIEIIAIIATSKKSIWIFSGNELCRLSENDNGDFVFSGKQNENSPTDALKRISFEAVNIALNNKLLVKVSRINNQAWSDNDVSAMKAAIADTNHFMQVLGESSPKNIVEFVQHSYKKGMTGVDIGNVSLDDDDIEETFEESSFSEAVERPSGEKYYPRQLGKFSDITVLRRGREKGLSFLLYSPPGTGKTAVLEAAFAGEVQTVNGTEGTERADLEGSWVPNPNNIDGKKPYIWEDGIAIKALRNNEVLYVDEIGRIPDGVLVYLYPLMDGRKTIPDPNPENNGQPLPIPDKFIIVASFNPGLGYGVDTALASRFAVHIEWTSDYDLASVLGVPGKAITVAKNLQKRFDTGQVGWVPQLRELLRFRDIANTYGQTFATNNMVGLAPAEDQIEVSKVISSVFGVKEDGMVQEPLRVGRQI